MITLPAYFMGFNSKADKSAGLRFATQELGPETFAEFQSLNGQFGWLVFKENSDTVPEVPEDNAEEEGKTQSERLRAVLFVWFKQMIRVGNLAKDAEFETFKRHHMEKFIEHIKSKLDD